MQYYFKAFRNYFNGNGRASRKEFWLFFLFHYIVLCICACLDGLFELYLMSFPFALGCLTVAYSLLSFFPYVCLRIRRLHDMNRNGAFWIFSNLPVIVFAMLIVYMLPGNAGNNKYGPPPVKNGEKTTVSASTCSYAAALKYKTNTQSKFCAYCGSKLAPEGLFCPNCGAQIPNETKQ